MPALLKSTSEPAEFVVHRRQTTWPRHPDMVTSVGITRLGADPVSGAPAGLVELLDAAAAQSDRVALFEKRNGNRAADTAASSGHDCNSVLVIRRESLNQALKLIANRV